MVGIRIIAIVALVVVVAGGLSGYYAWTVLNPPKPEVIRVGWPGGPKGTAYFPVELAKELLSEREGVALETANFRSHEALYAALLTGEIDIAFSNGYAVSNAIDKGVSVKVILGGWESFTTELVVPSSITDLSQLRGKTIAVFTILAMDTMALKSILYQQAGLVYGEDYNVQYISGSAERIAALVSGAVDAAVVAPESASKVVRETGGAFKIWAKISDYLPRMSAVVWVATEETIQKRPEVVRLFVEYMVLSYRDAYRHNATQLANLAVALEYPFTQEDMEAAFQEYFRVRLWPVNGGLSRDLWDAGSQYAQTNGFTERVIPYDEAVDDTMLNRALAKIGRV